jgi:methyltransferase
VNLLAFVLAVIVGLMLAETRLSRLNERRLLARGAVAPPGDVYGTLAFLYPAAFLLMGLEGLYGTAISPPVWTSTAKPSWFASGVLLFAASKTLKYWAIRSLGERWSFRVLILPGEPLVTTGPYRYIAHPNYVAVVGELVGTAMMFGARITGPMMIVLFGTALWARVRFETRVLKDAASGERATS